MYVCMLVSVCVCVLAVIEHVAYNRICAVSHQVTMFTSRQLHLCVRACVRVCVRACVNIQNIHISNTNV